MGIRSKEQTRAFKKRKEKKSCMFTGVESTREQRMRAPCAAAFGASRHRMVRCSHCVHPSWVCLDCWGAIADKTKTLVAERAGKRKLMQNPVYDALAGGVDFERLSAAAAASRSVAAGTTEGGGVLIKHRNGEWCWEGACPMCVEFPFPELKPALSLAASLALPDVLLSRTETGSIWGCSAVGHQYMQQVSDQQAAILILSVNLHPSPTPNPNRASTLSPYPSPPSLLTPSPLTLCLYPTPRPSRHPPQPLAPNPIVCHSRSKYMPTCCAMSSRPRRRRPPSPGCSTRMLACGCFTSTSKARVS